MCRAPFDRIALHQHRAEMKPSRFGRTSPVEISSTSKPPPREIVSFCAVYLFGGGAITRLLRFFFMILCSSNAHHFAAKVLGSCLKT